MGIEKYLNPQFDGGSPDVPYVVGDRYYGQDLVRDLLHMKEQLGKLAQYFIPSDRILKGCVPVANGFTAIDISLGVLVFKRQVKIPGVFGASPPPPVSTVDMDALITEIAAITNFNISGSATLNGVATNYIKMAHKYTDENTRNRAKKAGSYAYEISDDYTLTVNTTAPTAYEISLGTLVGDGSTFLTVTPTNANGTRARFEPSAVVGDLDVTNDLVIGNEVVSDLVQDTGHDTQFGGIMQDAIDFTQSQSAYRTEDHIFDIIDPLLSPYMPLGKRCLAVGSLDSDANILWHAKLITRYSATEYRIECNFRSSVTQSVNDASVSIEDGVTTGTQYRLNFVVFPSVSCNRSQLLN